MNLKEAFRYQNRLQAFLDTANSVLSDADNITQVTMTHLRHKVMPEVEDETIVDVPLTEYHEHITLYCVPWSLWNSKPLGLPLFSNAALKVDVTNCVVSFWETLHYACFLMSIL